MAAATPSTDITASQDEDTAALLKELEENESELEELDDEFKELICELIKEHKQLSKEPIDLLGNIYEDSGTCVDFSDIPSSDKQVALSAISISQTLKGVLDDLKARLGETTDFTGEFIPIGSTHSDTRSSPRADFDFLYVLSEPVSVQPTRDHNKFILIGNDGEIIQPLSLYERFANEIDSHLSSSTLPDQLSFAGFNQPDYSGVRYCEPAVTVLFQCKRSNNPVLVDISPSFRLPSQQVNTFKRVKAELLKVGFTTEQIETLDIESKLRLVPVHPEDERWWLSTAVLETAILKDIQGIEPARAVISHCKLINQALISVISEWYSAIVPVDDVVVIVQERIDNLLSFCRRERNSQNDTTQLSATRKNTKELLRYAHNILCEESGSKFNEFTAKPPISLNSCAIKFQVLCCYCDDQSGQNLLDKALTAFKTNNGLVDHLCLKYMINQFTVAAYSATQKSLLGCEMKRLLMQYTPQ